MLKGYLLANIDVDQRDKANDIWQETIFDLLKLGKSEDADFIRSWLRAKYAKEIRERKKNAENKDFEHIGTQFHKWVSSNQDRIGLSTKTNFYSFIQQDMVFFRQHYIRIKKASRTFDKEQPYLYYNASTYNNFTLQYTIALAPLLKSDDLDTVNRKIRLVTSYLDIWIARRIVNFRTLAYSSIVYTMFNLMQDIRDLGINDLLDVLVQKLHSMDETFADVDHFYMHQQNKRSVHYLLARMTDHIEQNSGSDPNFENYISRSRKKPFEVEHIWANKYERHHDEFTSVEQFNSFRNRFGGLILLPRGTNQSFGADTYEVKVKYYVRENALAGSLNDQYYDKNPNFTNYVKRSGLSFRSHEQFKRADLDQRQALYQAICEEIWNPARLQAELER
jgi:hypothetical protein